MRMQDKVVLVTGGAQGIGKATVYKFAAEGAKVAFCDLSEEAGKALCSELGDQHDFQVVDVVNAESVQNWVDSSIKRYERIDVLVNNAGITRDGLFVKFKDGEVSKKMSIDDFEKVIDVNLKAVFHCTQAVVPQMISQQHGVILNASSVVGLYGNLGQTNYVASKAGVVGMTKVWSRELGRYGIRVNAVSPGFISTEMVAKVPEKILESMCQRTPLGRMGKPEEVANVYLWLASEEAGFVTGANISVDGGLVIGT